ncbi:hypothetical protein MD484_g4968, partial [Candolleomyces efflorescens]
MASGAGNGDPNDSSPSDLSDDSNVRPAVAPEPGPSRNKGKGPDPRNWGGVDWGSDLELDEQAQAAALEHFNEKRKSKKKKKSKPSRCVAEPSPDPPARVPNTGFTSNNIPRRERSVLPIPSILNSIFND